MARAFGIDFGTTNSVVAYADSGTRRALALTAANGRPHPSVVWFRADGKSIVGSQAKANLNSYADLPGNQFVKSVKRQLGRRSTLNVFGQPKSCVEVASEIFRHLREHTLEEHRMELTSATVTIPVYFDGQSRHELRMAADRAGIFIKNFVHEPFAAVVGYCVNTLGSLEGRTILVFDWGGGTLDITVTAVKDGAFIQLSAAELNDRAGDHFDQKVSNLCYSRFLDANALQATDIRISPSAKDRFLLECERAKIELSAKELEQLGVAQLVTVDRRVYDLSQWLSRADFEASIQIDVKDALTKVDLALADASLTARDIDLALLVGGSSRIPLVQREMQERFGARIVNVKNADTIIAEGAALVDALGMQPVLARSIGVQLSDGSYYEFFPAGTIGSPTVCSKTINFFCTDNRDGEAKVVVVEQTETQQITKGVLSIPVSRAKRKGYSGHERVVVNFGLDEDLIMHVSGKGATQATGNRLTLHNLFFALNLAEAAIA